MNEETKTKIENSFKFTQKGLERRKYHGENNQPNKLYDTHTEGLSLFIRPSGEKTFYAFTKVKCTIERKAAVGTKQQIQENVSFPQIPKVFGCSEAAAPNYFELIKNPKKAAEAAAAETSFSDLAKAFLKSGVSGFRLADKSEKREYKKSTIKKYVKIINGYILLNKNKFISTEKKKAWDKKCKLLSGFIEVKGKASQRYF